MESRMEGSQKTQSRSSMCRTHSTPDCLPRGLIQHSAETVAIHVCCTSPELGPTKVSNNRETDEENTLSWFSSCCYDKHQDPETCGREGLSSLQATVPHRGKPGWEPEAGTWHRGHGGELLRLAQLLSLHSPSPPA